jgi:hypothetical protein
MTLENPVRARDDRSPAHSVSGVSVNRRGLLMNIAVGTITSATALASSSALAHAMPAMPDPIFAAIDAHRLANEAFARACVPWSRLEMWKPEVASAPETAALNGAADAASDEADAAALTLLDVAPTTIAGCVALLRYANNYVERNGDDVTWPHHLVEAGQEDDDDAPVRSWTFFLHAHVADALEAIEARGLPVASPRIVASKFSTQGNPDDAEAIRLTHQFLELAQQYDLVVDAEEAAGERFSKISLPKAPSALRLSHDDCLLLGGMFSSRGDLITDHQVDLLRWQFSGTKRVPDPTAQKRADKIVATYDRWQGRIQKIRERSGYAEAERESQAAFDRLYHLSETILALPVEGLDGLAAKAVVQAWLQRGADESEEKMPLEALAGRLIARDLYRLKAGSPLIEAMGRIRYLDGTPIDRS